MFGRLFHRECPIRSVSLLVAFVAMRYIVDIVVKTNRLKSA